MSFKNILVYQPLEDAKDSTLSIAIDLAQRSNAKLIGVAASAVNPTAYATGAFASAIIDRLRPLTEKGLKESAGRFLAATKGKVDEVEWRQALAKPTDFVAQQARAADLVVTAATRRTYFDPLTELDPGLLVLQAGRPVLLVPPEAQALKATHIVIAWKDTREARRAVLDALPLLQGATDVTVAEIVEPSQRNVAAGAGEDVVAWLGRHDVCATAHSVISDYDSYGAFEGLLLQNAADLIVAGAYGHNRFQEWIFGGVTHDLMMKSRHCCLFSN
jgi:nucleotide-binding universal stress UspA family protein